MNLPDHFTSVLVNEAARILQASPETVRHWADVGLLPVLKTERGVRLFDRRDVERLAREREDQRRSAKTPSQVGAAPATAVTHA